MASCLVASEVLPRTNSACWELYEYTSIVIAGLISCNISGWVGVQSAVEQNPNNGFPSRNAKSDPRSLQIRECFSTGVEP
jgi:hypothetical protein